ncbi:hypothetical protein [Pseudonocardia sp. HH130630-07]|uniref:hypothetical protein n=1 Tax=Pseudonocardia sp. HH130630-07 TaxID=1690815 RepID=UPI0008151E24|nr:hypothetical protein [Pseudonocardia sp. HH130630-07]ANY09247.1 hypothetical protein AFB00_26745 [Pseudonocardia sp. HH130630-07]
MILLCERCYAPIDPALERHYRLAHIDHADTAGTVVWRDAVVHSDACPAAGGATGRDRAA